ARLAAGELSAVGVERERAIEGEGPVGEKPPDLALAAEAVILELDRDHDGIVVVGLDKVHVGWAVARGGPEKIAIELPAAAQGRDLARRMIVLLEAGEDANALAGRRPVERADHDGIGASARQHAIVETDRIGDDPAVEIVLDRHGPPQQ